MACDKKKAPDPTAEKATKSSDYELPPPPPVILPFPDAPAPVEDAEEPVVGPTDSDATETEDDPSGSDVLSTKDMIKPVMVQAMAAEEAHKKAEEVRKKADAIRTIIKTKKATMAPGEYRKWRDKKAEGISKAIERGQQSMKHKKTLRKDPL